MQDSTQLSLLEHFKEVLKTVEEKPPLWASLRRQKVPSSLDDFEGEPLLLPATWAPNWTETLGASDLQEGISRLLGDLVEVEVFRLHYSCRQVEKLESSGDISKKRANVDFESNEMIPQKFKNCLEEPEFKNISDFENFTDVSESIFLENVSVEHSQRTGERNREENRPSFSSMDPITFRKTDEENSIVSEKNLDLTQLPKKTQHEEKLSWKTPENSSNSNTHTKKCVNSPSKIAPLSSQKSLPVPKSVKETMYLGKFLEEAQKLTKSLKKTELLYLTWRGLPGPDSLNSSDLPEFRFFVEKLLHPTLSPPFLSSKMVTQRNFWIGNIVTSRLHFDALDNLHVCFYGSKVVHLYSPWDTKYLYPEPWKKDGLNNWSSLPSILCANHGKHPLFFQQAKAFRAVIRAGEALYIPAGWWHEVFTLDFTFSVNLWFEPGKMASFRPTLMMLQSEKYHRFVMKRNLEDEYDNGDNNHHSEKKFKI